MFREGVDCGSEPSCVVGCCRKTCTETYSYQCPINFDDSITSCDEVPECLQSCLYYSSSCDDYAGYKPCWGTQASCAERTGFKPSEGMIYCDSDMSKDAMSCYMDTSIPQPVRKNITGYVRDSNGNSLVNVFIFSSSGISTITNVSGGYILPDVSDGTYTITAKKFGYGDKSSNAVVENTQDKIPVQVDIILFRKSTNSVRLCYFSWWSSNRLSIHVKI